tara:strand:- start:36 stop:629 length:594 start_codon:yes stop_codon:yes gene_type:complete
MKDMVSQVVEVLDEGNSFMSPNRVLKSRVKKLQHSRKPIRPATTTGELDALQKHKERDRKRVKDQHQKAPLKWNNGATRWVVRQQEHDEILREIQHLNEISLRTIGIGASLGLVKRWSSKATQGINKLKSLGTRLKTAPDDPQRTKLQGEIVSVDATVFDALRKMMMYSATLNASGLIGLERTLIKKLTLTKQWRKK